jgi:hypothetical protein
MDTNNVSKNQEGMDVLIIIIIVVTAATGRPRTTFRMINHHDADGHNAGDNDHDNDSRTDNNIQNSNTDIKILLLMMMMNGSNVWVCRDLRDCRPGLGA